MAASKRLSELTNTWVQDNSSIPTDFGEYTSTSTFPKYFVDPWNPVGGGAKRVESEPKETETEPAEPYEPTPEEVGKFKTGENLSYEDRRLLLIEKYNKEHGYKKSGPRILEFLKSSHIYPYTPYTITHGSTYGIGFGVATAEALVDQVKHEWYSGSPVGTPYNVSNLECSSNKECPPSTMCIDGNCEPIEEA